MSDEGGKTKFCVCVMDENLQFTVRKKDIMNITQGMPQCLPPVLFAYLVLFIRPTMLSSGDCGRLGWADNTAVGELEPLASSASARNQRCKKVQVRKDPAKMCITQSYDIVGSYPW